MPTTRYLEAIFTRTPGEKAGVDVLLPMTRPDSAPPARLEDPLPEFSGTWVRVTGDDERPARYEPAESRAAS